MQENKNIDIEEEGISLGDIFGWIWKGKIPAIISAGVVFLITFIALAFVIAPSSQVYVVEFDYSSVPGLSGGTYLDGTRFSYQDIIVEEHVLTVIENNQKEYAANETIYDYSKIDLEELYGSNLLNVDINRVYWENVDSEAEPELKATHYMLSIPKSSFDSAAQAKAFAKDLIELPLKKTQEMIESLDFTTNLDMYKSVVNFSTKLGYLESQINLLQSGYNSFNGIVSGTQYTIDGETYNFAAINAGISDFLESKNYSIMASEIRQVGYVNDKEEARQKYLVKMDDLEKEEDYLKKQLESVNATYNEAKSALESIGTGSIVTTDQVLSLLTQLNDTLLNQKTTLEFQIISNQEEQRKLNIKIDALNSLTDAENQAFLDRLDEIYARLVLETKKYDKVYKAITTRNMFVYYANSNIVTLQSDMSSLMVYGIPVALGVVCFVAVAWIYGYLKSKKELEKKPEPEVQQ